MDQDSLKIIHENNLHVIYLDIINRFNKEGSMQSEKLRLRKIQHLAYEITDEMNRGKELIQLDTLIPVIDNLSRAIGDLTDSFGKYSLDNVEERVKNAHSLLFNKDSVNMY